MIHTRTTRNLRVVCATQRAHSPRRGELQRRCRKEHERKATAKEPQGTQSWPRRCHQVQHRDDVSERSATKDQGRNPGATTDTGKKTHAEAPQTRRLSGGTPGSFLRACCFLPHVRADNCIVLRRRGTPKARNHSVSAAMCAEHACARFCLIHLAKVALAAFRM